jgi:hypothetical protein
MQSCTRFYTLLNSSLLVIHVNHSVIFDLLAVIQMLLEMCALLGLKS